MIEVLQEENEAVRVFLVGKRKNCRREEYPGEKDGPDLDELRGLAGTLGMVVAGELVVGDFVPGPVYLVGKGKVGLGREQEEHGIALSQGRGLEVQGRDYRNFLPAGP